MPCLTKLALLLTSSHSKPAAARSSKSPAIPIPQMYIHMYFGCQSSVTLSCNREKLPTAVNSREKPDKLRFLPAGAYIHVRLAQAFDSVHTHPCASRPNSSKSCAPGFR